MRFLWLMILCTGKLVMSETVEKVAPAVELGEGPHWDATNQKLFYVDIDGQKVLRLDPATGKVTSATFTAGPVEVVVPHQGMKDKLVVACGTGIYFVTWDGEKDVVDPPSQKIATLDIDRNNDTRINDGKCDSSGRLWVGTMAKKIDNAVDPYKGSLYILDHDLNLKKVLSPVSISNGLTWNLHNDVFYYIDSVSYQIWCFDYNHPEGSISNLQILFDLKKNNVTGLPDGMTIDADGNLWIALHEGGAVIQVDPKSGKLLRTVKLPIEKATSVTFGGPQLDILYVTSARDYMTPTDLKKAPDSGALFAVKGLGVKGVPANQFVCNKPPL